MKEAVYTPGKSCGLPTFGNIASNGSDHVYDVLQLYFIAPLCFLGLPRNIIAFFIFAQIGHQNATTFLMHAFAVIDSCVLLWGMAFHVQLSLRYILCGVYSNEKENCDPLEYSLHRFGQITNINLMACIWTSVIIGMNRYIAVCWPLQATRLCTVSNARKQILGAILESIAYSLPGFFETKLEQGSHNSSYSVKHPLYSNDGYFYTYFVGCCIAFGIFIPFGLSLFLPCVSSPHYVRPGINQSAVMAAAKGTPRWCSCWSFC